MQHRRTKHSLWTLAISALWLGLSATVAAEPYVEGPKKCQECHEEEYKVWEGTKHFESYKTLHKKDKAKDIVKALGGKRLKKDKVCTQCHYTMVQKDAGDDGKAEAGPSCESCHGASSEWRQVHNDYGGPKVKAENETPEHKAKRVQAAKDAGMIWSSMRYDIAANCMECHGLANPNVSGEELAKMLEAGHPLKPDFELVKYSQGKVRHRFYPPDVTKNAEMGAAELSRLFVEGQAAKLVSATQAANKSDHPKYKEAQQARIESAKKALANVAEAKDFLADPSDANARKLVEAIKDKDLSAQVGSLLPAKDSYK